MNESNTAKPQQSKFVGEFTIGQGVIDTMRREEPTVEVVRLDEVDPSAKMLNQLLTEREVEVLIGILSGVEWIPVGINGMKQQYFDVATDTIGSYRASAYSKEFADILWQRIKDCFDDIREMSNATQTDWDGSKKWRPAGVNPLHRFIKYEDGGSLLPHYDAPFIYDHTKRTLMSLVLYIDRSPTIIGGATRYLKDPQKELPATGRNLDDWKNFATDNDVRVAYDPARGSALLFDHRILHDSESVSGAGQKLILRTDIDFERIDD
jgi:hypothetical protein